ncbi:hypothetical protein HF086_009981 [Spodoptera exigua]|uniref:separase n=1 Tax=Spodoptera exigua TaxID=7107 RepID=A0A922MQE0_SPOEX|nr:hypothetical protein HF086_009981 [Spodoptera exigua]
MEDFDVFTNEINFTKPLFKNILNKYVNDAPPTPNGPNYQSGRKLMAEECLASNDDIGCAFHLSEAASASLRTMAVYRDEQLKAAGNKLHKITSYIEPVQHVIDANPIPKKEKKLIDLLSGGTDNITDVLKTLTIEKEVPFHKRYLHFSKENNIDNFRKILKELPKEGEKPLFTELFSILDENYKTIDNAQFLNNKRLVQNYWSRREDIDLRMKVSFIRLTQKQKILLYNLIECSPVLQSQQIKSCIRRILTEHGNIEDVRQVMNSECGSCTKEFRFLNGLCLKCLSKCFEKLHHFSLVDGIKAFSQTASIVKDNDEWTGLKKAKRYPVILIVDERLDTFPWETLPILNQHPVCRMENIHFLYYLYKVHEKNIVDGYYAAKCEVGRYVINPEKNLDRMENRMTSFVEYWCPTWKGHVGEAPSPADFISHISEADVFFPMVVGMLWEVTDLEVDKVISTLVSLYVPSDAPVPWQHVGKAKWSNRVLDTSVENPGQVTTERDLLRAICRARGSTSYVMIACSVVARGLPIRLRE